MSTKAILRARIASDLIRSDIDTLINEAIDDAIAAYQHESFHFNEARSMSFTTANGVWSYTTGDDNSISNIRAIDAVHLTESGRVHELMPRLQTEIEAWTEGGTSTHRGQPTDYSWFGQAFYLDPIPDKAYPIRIIGTIRRAKPASDSEADNVWMTEAFELIRCRAKGYLGIHVLYDPELVQAMGVAEQDAVKRLYAKKHRLDATNQIVPTKF